MYWDVIFPLGIACLASFLLIPLVRRGSIRLGRVSRPRADRWHKKPTPTLGGVGIFLAFGLTLTARQLYDPAGEPLQWGFMSGAVLLFLTGVYDEFRPLSPIAKLLMQILAATMVIGLGYTSTFFTPRLSNPLLAQIPNILLTYIWLVGITNAINLLDNMDGLAGGLSLITASVLGYFFWQDTNLVLLWAAAALVGSLLGFLTFNFPPAKIFMGDSGSLFLGFTLASLAIAQQQQASNVFAVIGVPTLIFLLPILDTALVTLTRLMRGQSPVQGGRDHTSHRLVAFGLNERQAVLTLYGIALVSAILAAVLEATNYWLSLALAPLLILSLALLAAYLGRLKMVTSVESRSPHDRIGRWMTDLTYRRRLFEVILDFFLIAIGFYLAFLAGYDLKMDELRLEIYLDLLPFAFACSYLGLFLFGVYRVVWRYASFDDLARYFQAALGGTALFATAIFGFQALMEPGWGGEFQGVILIYFGVFLFGGLALTRSSFRILDTLIQPYLRTEEQSVLIFGAGDSGEMALRWMMMNPELKYRPIGFIDPDPFLRGRRIHGVKVLGGLDILPGLLEEGRIAGIILTEMGENATTTQVKYACEQFDCWVRRLRLEFEEIDFQEELSRK